MGKTALQNTLALGVEPFDSDHWETPQPIFDAISALVGGFDLDACATWKNAKCARFYTDQPIEGQLSPEHVGTEGDALTLPWTGTVWCNPPYSNPAPWLAKGGQEGLQGNTVVCLVPAATGTRYWHEHVWPHATAVWFRQGRIRFHVDGKDPLDGSRNSRFDSALVIFGPMPEPREIPEEHKAELAKWFRVDLAGKR